MVIRQLIAICRRQLQIALKLGNINGHLSHILELCECDRLWIVALGEPAESSLLLSLFEGPNIAFRRIIHTPSPS